ncbi:hypothetical protein BH11GEM1_BH11GEM1_02420 [soil metagenome]
MKRERLDWLADVIIEPAGDSTRFGYFPIGDVQWQEDGRGSVNRAQFTYNTNRVLATIQSPGNSAQQLDQFDYDGASGNLQRVTSPLGFAIELFRDALGRDTLVVTPTDASQSASLSQRG